MDKASAARAAEIQSLLHDLPKDQFGAFRNPRLRQLARIGVSMTATLSDLDYEFLKAEIRIFRKANEVRLEKWRRFSGNH